MKRLMVFVFLAITGGFCAEAAGAKPYDTTQFAWWAAASNENDENSVSFVSRSDTIGDTIFPIRYQKYQGSALVEDDTIAQNWDRRTSFGNSRFSLALDRFGAAHFVYCDSGRCVYAANRFSGGWKTRYKTNRVAGNIYGRINCLALYVDQLDIVYTNDYRVGGGYPFSTMYRINTNVISDSVENTYITSSQAIYDEMIYDVAISNQCGGRLVIFFGLRQFGGWQADKILVSQSYPVISDYYYLELRSAWSLNVTPVSILSDEPAKIVVAVGSSPFKNYPYTIYLTDSGLSAIKIPIRPASGFSSPGLLSADQKAFDLGGRILPARPGSALVPRIFFLRTAESAARTIKRLSVVP